MDLKEYVALSGAMLRVGIFGYGGGPSVIPLFRHEAVTRYKWMTDKEFGELLAFANALPGPIATKLAAQLGYQQKGAMGAVVAILAHILPTTIAMVALLGALYAMKESVIVAGMIAAVRPVIAVLLGITAYEFCAKTWGGLGKIIGVGFGVIAFLLLGVLDVHPAIVIITFLAYGTVHIKVFNWAKRKWGGKESIKQNSGGMPS
ncbi:MAG TPA: chromate transporter [Bacillus bacterium]|uniref:Transporter YwrB n=1 Tax=Siminovitchia fordii TaxID=254759 RepID=A0ABQ4K7A7_9BACI|nr:chromate transporter [Siminovitchia fordii]GIN21601.1 putative transporter YwrB [Siminovitchia fordii]HBZ09889.1 chromate transporter [Bacillus sp. (in: firmicutes)]